MLRGNVVTDVSKKTEFKYANGSKWRKKYGGKNSEKCEDEVLKWTGTKPFLHVQLS